MIVVVDQGSDIEAVVRAMPDGADATVLIRVAHGTSMAVATELACRAIGLGAHVHEWFGPPQRVLPAPTALLQIVPDIRERRVLVCGDRRSARRINAAARAAGVLRDRVIWAAR